MHRKHVTDPDPDSEVTEGCGAWGVAESGEYSGEV